MKTRETVDDRLDHLYMKAIRCPYCRTRIPKGTYDCPNCGITKKQIYNANLVLSPKKARQAKVHQQVIYSKVRPASIPFWKMGLGGMFGFLGIHCFVAKRYRRGLLILTTMLLFVVLSMIFHPAVDEIPAHEWRIAFDEQGLPFPSDFLGLVPLVMWIWDWSAILLGKFKYPVILDEAQK